MRWRVEQMDTKMVLPSLTRCRLPIGRVRFAIGRSSCRSYVTRSEFDSPFDHLRQRKKGFVNWTATTGFLALGLYLGYNNTLFNIYEKYAVDVEDENDELLPIQLTHRLKQLPIYQKLNHPRNEGLWTKTESWEDLDHNSLYKHGKGSREKIADDRSHSVVSHTLARPGGFLIKPVTFFNKDTNESVSIIHVGRKLCGYPFLVHGGIIATILNETFKRNASLSAFTKSRLKDDFKVESLQINYKAPTLANQFLVIHTVVEKGVDDKTLVLGSTMKSEKGKVLVKGGATLHDTQRASNAINSQSKKWIIF